MADSVFSDLDRRTEAGADRIFLKDHVVEADIGAFQPERGRRQRLRFDVVVEVPTVAAGDDVDRILSYDRIVWAIAAELAAERLNLLETLAERVAARILAEPGALRVFLRIGKLDLGAYVLGVEVVRTPADVGPAGLAAPVPVVRVVPADIPDLAARVALWKGQPTILCVPPLGPVLATGHAPTQRRVDLLAIEQAGWMLAARDPACVVVATRTEIDWALRRGGLVVWAPSKMVLDARDAPRGADPAVLAAWLAGALGADCVHVHGNVAIPAGTRVPLMRAA
jgi:7,8-dihydroneopterin aldolase/epimerase/oxygenase